MSLEYFAVHSVSKLKKPLEDYEMLCRGCLTEAGEMKNIFDWGLEQDFIDCTNVQLQKCDGIPELLCERCEHALTISKQFREHCRKADDILQRAKKKKQLGHINKEREYDDADGFLLQKNKQLGNINQEREYDGADNQIRENRICQVLNDNELIFKITAPDMYSKIYLTCPHCQIGYIKITDLMLHLVKSHKIQENNFRIVSQYYCSMENCQYFLDSGQNKYFRGRKFLNQHFKKVHTPSPFVCVNCRRTFDSKEVLEEHATSCDGNHTCEGCHKEFCNRDRLLVHLLRKHPDLHKQYKMDRNLKRSSSSVVETKKLKSDSEKFDLNFGDSPKRSFATQTVADKIKNDVSLASWQKDNYEIKTDEISTQTGFEDILSLKSQTSEDSLFFAETVSLSDIQTQTFPLEFGLSRSNKETLTSETQIPDLSIKETQTCFCLYDSPRPSTKLFESVSSSPCSLNLITTETQTNDVKTSVKSDVLLGCNSNSAQTQTSFEDCLEKSL